MITEAEARKVIEEFAERLRALKFVADVDVGKIQVSCNISVTPKRELSKEERAQVWQIELDSTNDGIHLSADLRYVRDPRWVSAYSGM